MKPTRIVDWLTGNSALRKAGNHVPELREKAIKDNRQNEDEDDKPPMLNMH